MEQYRVMRAHLLDLHAFYGEPMGLRIARKHIGWDLDGIPGLAPVKRAFNRLDDGTDQVAFLDELFNTLDQQELAA
jgi:tRNA-dihydrouridine synthase B